MGTSLTECEPTLLQKGVDRFYLFTIPHGLCVFTPAGERGIDTGIQKTNISCSSNHAMWAYGKEDHACETALAGYRMGQSVEEFVDSASIRWDEEQLVQGRP